MELGTSGVIRQGRGARWGPVGQRGACLGAFGACRERSFHARLGGERQERRPLMRMTGETCGCGGGLRCFGHWRATVGLGGAALRYGCGGGEGGHSFCESADRGCHAVCAWLGEGVWKGGPLIVRCGIRGLVGDEFGWETGNEWGLSGEGGHGDIRYSNGAGRGLRGRLQRRGGCDGLGRRGVRGRDGQMASSDGIGGRRGQTDVK